MGESVRLAVFDCDGTLVDSQHTIIDTMGLAFHAVGLTPPEPEAVRHLVGLSLETVIERLAPDQTADQQAAIVAAYRANFHEIHARPGQQAPLFPGAVAALEALEAAGFLLGVATGKGQRGLRAVLTENRLEQRFVTLQTADRAPNKPAPGMLLQAMAETGAEAADTIMVGDTTYDMEMAGNAGVAAIGVAWGYHPVRDLLRAGAKTVIDRFEDLPDALGV